jgi:SEC-C motif
MKIDRNAPCPCGSGKKYKRCCGDLTKKPKTSPKLRPSTEQTLRWRAQEMLGAHRAAENVRQRQQGYGKPIISLVDHGYRIVAVGNTVFWGQKWVVFPDFLFYFLKKTLGFEWGSRAQRGKSPHPIFRWLAKINDYTAKHGTGHGRVKSGPLIGFLSGTLHLAYGLYLIAHNDEMPKRLLRRLRDSATFMPAYYELLVGAALAVAGFEIANAEMKATSKSTPEFRARSKTSGKVYEVEAKRKDRWTAPTADVNSEDFKKELERYVRDQIYNASKKRLQNPIFWLELSIPTLSTEADWCAVAAHAKSIIREAEKMTIEGEPLSPAFVVITNHTFLANEDVAGEPTFAFLQTLHIPDYPFGRAMEIEDALEGYDKHRDVFWMMEAWRLARTIPTTFDATPPELLSPDGQPQKTVQIGDTLLVPDKDGNEVAVRVEDIASIGDKVMVAVHDVATNRRWLAQFPLTEGETQAAARFTDAIFGKDNASRGLRDSDPFDLYDWPLKVYADTKPEQLAKLIREDAGLRQYEGLAPAEARVRLAREYTKRIWVMSQARKETSPRTEQT